ncbi:MAG: NAD(P)/FAD-dependent oxidoreductase, partial [Chitinophagaceae bacterium]|nr:NAD(P)/FAD-dependent oxidoreductase [Rubrivivax sp.]
APSPAAFHRAQVVPTVPPQPDGRLAVETDTGTRFLAKTLFIAGGAGSFQPRGLKVESLAGFEGSQVVHGVDDPARFAGLKVVIVGGADVALTEALNMARGSANPAASVTLIHRRDQFQAPAAQVAAVKAMCASGQMRFIAGQVVDSEAEQGRLAHLVVAGTDGETQRVPVDMLVVCLGLSPRLGPIAHWGLGSVRKQLTVDTEKFQTNVPGIFAVGDINSYPGKRKLIVSGFHEATLAAFAAAAQVFPDQPVLLQYTTTSPRLHERLGVRPPLLPD